ncbi:MAG: hypothetical protein ACT4PL_09800 [Phycisphaerales bacterium]
MTCPECGRAVPYRLVEPDLERVERVRRILWVVAVAVLAGLVVVVGLWRGVIA